MRVLCEKRARRGKRVSDAEFRRLWDDPALTLAAIGAKLEISVNAVLGRARVRGLSARPDGRRPVYDRALLVALYRLGLSEQAVADRVGCARSVVNLALRAAGVARRERGKPSPLRPEAAREALLALALRGVAQETTVAMRDAEMVDHLWTRRKAAA
jgi:hypothetical protein